ncbi:MAG: OmpW family outer membrane protein [Pseudomonadota bacterium]
MKKYSLTTAAAIAAFAASSAIAGTAHAGSTDGRFQVKLLGTGVLPDGKIDEVKFIDPTLAGLPAFAAPQTKANDNYVPTIAVEYFFTPNISAETICCTTAHHVTGQGSAAGASLVDHVLIVPATLTVKYHLPLGPIKPYVGAGPSVFIVLDDRPGDTARALGVTNTKLSSQVGVALQAGVDVPLGDTGLGLSLDAKKYWVNTTAHFYAGSTEVLTTKHKLDPWLLSAGLSYRF